MFRRAVSTVLWVGKGTVFLVGLTVIFAVVLGVATTAAAHTGFPRLFHLGHDNPVTSLSKMTGSVANGVLQVTNEGFTTTQDATAITATNNSDGSPTVRATNANGSPALDLNVGQSCTTSCTRKAPMTVNSSARVDKLNADLLDGMDSTDFISGLEYRVGALEAFDSSAVKTAIVSCSPGKHALGGGHSFSGTPAELGNITVTRSTVANAHDAWFIEAREIGAGTTTDWGVRATVTCADVSQISF
jgi:hypothetical protein